MTAGRRTPAAAGAEGSARRGGPFWRHPALAAGLAGLVLYLPALGGGFVWDDHLLIEQNPLLRSVDGLVHALRSDFWAASGGAGASGLWRPAISLSYAVDGALAHWSPAFFHLMNVLAHAAASALVAALVLGGGLSPLLATLAGLLFAAMPAHAESVAWVSGRTDVYCAVFFLLALLLDRRARARGRAWPGVAPLVAVTLALLSKETAVPFAIVVAVAEWVEPAGRRRPGTGSIRWLLPYASVTAVYLLVHALWGGRSPGAAVTEAAQAQWLRALALMFPGYVAFGWPWFTHTPAVTLEPGRTADWVVAAAVVVQVLFAAWWIWLAWRRRPVALPLALFWLTLLPTLMVNALRGYALYAERFFYLPSAGLIWALAHGVGALRANRTQRVAGATALAVLAMGSAGVLWTVVPDWHSDETLFASMARRAPRNYMARTQWARRLVQAGRLEEAGRELAAARALDATRPGVPEVEAALAWRRGDFVATLAAAERALAAGSVENTPRLLRVAALLSLGRVEEGRRALEEMRRLTPGQPAVESLWGQYLVSVGRSAEAYPVLAQAARLLPQDAALAYALALAANDTGRHAEARATLERLLAREPARREAWIELARTCGALGDAAGAAAAVARAQDLAGAAGARPAAPRP